MAKQRPPVSPRSRKMPPSEERPSRPVVSESPGRPPTPRPRQPQRRTSYLEAVALYERGVQALQRRDFRAAAGLFETVLRQYPEEKELHERVRLYLNICRREAEPHDAAPKTLEERLYAATLAINSGRYDEAIANLRLVRDEEPDNDHALYMLAVSHAQRAEPAEAVAHLERAIALNPENRALARNDPDLDPLRGNEAFRAALDVGATLRADRRRPLRPRPNR